MFRLSRSVFGATVALAGMALGTTASALTETVQFDHLVESATVATSLGVGDTLFLDTLVTSEFGALSQSITFTLGAGVGAANGSAAWLVSTAAGPGPRLTGVNIDVFDAGNSLVFSDTFVGVTGGVAVSTFASSIGPGTYKLVATGTGVRDSSLDVAISFAVPEPSTYALMLAGAGVIGFVARRRRPYRA